jgi:hypothetical protein
LSFGQQAVQSCHAMQEFVHQHPELNMEWYSKSNYLGLLSVSCEEELEYLLNDAYKFGIKCSLFREPDIGNQITAICLEPGQKSKKLCSRIPLALKE